MSQSQRKASVPIFTSTARGEKVYRTIPADAKRTPQESEEERA